MMTPAQRKLVWVLVAALLAGAAMYHAKGLALLFGPGGGVDVHLRWQEQRYVIRGQNPYDVTYAALRVGRLPADPTRDAAADPAVGVPDSGGYPPWAFLFGWAMFWPPWPAAKGYFLAVSLLLTAATAAWAYRAVRPFGGPGAGWLSAASVLAVSGYSTCVHVGQYGAVVTGLLALSLWALAAGRDVAGGLLLGLAMLKPTIAGPFFLVLVVTGRWRAAVACVGYVAAASGAVWAQTRTDPVEMFRQSVAVTDDFVHDSQGLVAPLLALGLSPGQVTPLLAAGVGLPGLAALYRLRRRSLLELFAVAAVVGRLWAYHKGYDNMMLAFLLATLTAAAVARPSPTGWAALLAAGAAAWAPASLTARGAAAALAVIGWLVGLAAVAARPLPPTPPLAPRTLP